MNYEQYDMRLLHHSVGLHVHTVQGDLYLISMWYDALYTVRVLTIIGHILRINDYFKYCTKNTLSY